MNLIELGSAQSPAGLCRLMDYNSGAMTRLVDQLVRIGVLHRIRSVRDRRRVILDLTQKGKELVPVLYETAQAVQRQFLRGFTPSEKSELECLLERMIQNARQQ